MSPKDITCIAAAVFIAAAIGFFAASLFFSGRVRRAERNAWRQIDQLLRARAIQDNRDSRRLF